MKIIYSTSFTDIFTYTAEIHLHSLYSHTRTFTLVLPVALMSAATASFTYLYVHRFAPCR
jgi:hypothetical protein